MKIDETTHFTLKNFGGFNLIILKAINPLEYNVSLYRRFNSKFNAT